MRHYWPWLITTVVALVALAGGTMLWRVKRLPLADIPRHPTDSSEDAAATLHVRGASTASVTLEEFADFQCHACATLVGPINEVERDYQQRVRIVFRHFPLAGHNHAQEAAVAAEAAGRQGRFWDMHDLLYRQQETWSRAADVRVLFQNYARTLGLDLTRFKKDMESDETRARVLAEQQQGRRLGVTSTPTVLINKRALPASALNAPGLRKAVAAELGVQPPR